MALLRAATGPVIPVGTIIQAIGSPDSTWLRCDGQVLNQSAYPAYVAKADNLHPAMWKQWNFIDVDQSVNETYKYAVSIMGDVVVVIGAGSTVWTSDDQGETWSTAASLGTGSHYCLSNNGTYFVALQSGSANAWYSSDGVTWNTATLGVSGNWKFISYANGVFVVMPNGYTSGNYIYSSNGTAWSSATVPYSPGYCWALGGDGSQHLMYATDDSASYLMYKSTNGSSWTAGTIDFNNEFSGTHSRYIHCLSYVNGEWVLIFENEYFYYVYEGTDVLDPNDYARYSLQPAATYNSGIGLKKLLYTGSHYILANIDTGDGVMVGKTLNNMTAFRSNMQYTKDMAYGDGFAICIPSGYSSLTWRSIGKSYGVDYDSATQFQLPHETIVDNAGLYNFIKVAE